MVKIYLRLGNIVFSKTFLETVKELGFIPTRKSKFRSNGILINHGCSKPFKLSKNVSEFYIINQPDAIKYCSNKLLNYNILKDFYPEIYKYKDINTFPIVAKLKNGHHGYGFTYINNLTELNEFRRNNDISKYIFQRAIDIKHEFRFNVFDKLVYQVSHREKLDSRTEGGGLEFEYRSLGQNAKISTKFWNYVYDVIDVFHKSVGNTIAHYCIDVMKGYDKNYYLTELNSAYGIGNYTASKLIDLINDKYANGDLDKYGIKNDGV